MPQPLLEIAATLAAEFAASAAENDRNGSPPLANLALARDAGMLGLTVPERLGGMGANLATFAECLERIARGDGSTGLILAMHNMLIGGENEAGLWPESLFEEVCRAATDEGALVNSAATEPGSGSPSQGGLPATRAEPKPDGGWRLYGRKAYTTGAPMLRYLRVSARVDAEPASYSARFLVRLPADGVTIRDGWDPIGLRATAGEDIVMFAAPATFLYREEQRGCEGTVWFQVAVAATYLGIGQAALDACLALLSAPGSGAESRHLADLDSVRIRVGRITAALMVARRNLLSTCREWLATDPAARPRLVTSFGLAKVVAVNAAEEATDGAMRLAGGAGLSRALPLERFLREVRAGFAHPPVEDVAYLALARELISEG